MAEARPNDDDPAESKESSRFMVNRVSLDFSGTPDENESLRSSSDVLIESATYEYDTRYSKSLGQLTREVSPRADFYQDVNSINHQLRPTLEELHEARAAAKVSFSASSRNFCLSHYKTLRQRFSVRSHSYVRIQPKGARSEVLGGPLRRIGGYLVLHTFLTHELPTQLSTCVDPRTT